MRERERERETAPRGKVLLRLLFHLFLLYFYSSSSSSSASSTAEGRICMYSIMKLVRGLRFSHFVHVEWWIWSKWMKKPVCPPFTHPPYSFFFSINETVNQMSMCVCVCVCLSVHSSIICRNMSPYSSFPLHLSISSPISPFHTPQKPHLSISPFIH